MVAIIVAQMGGLDGCHIVAQLSLSLSGGKAGGGAGEQNEVDLKSNCRIAIGFHGTWHVLATIMINSLHDMGIISELECVKWLAIQHTNGDLTEGCSSSYGVIINTWSLASWSRFNEHRSSDHIFTHTPKKKKKKNYTILHIHKSTFI